MAWQPGAGPRNGPTVSKDERTPVPTGEEDISGEDAIREGMRIVERLVEKNAKIKLRHITMDYQEDFVDFSSAFKPNPREAYITLHSEDEKQELGVYVSLDDHCYKGEPIWRTFVEEPSEDGYWSNATGWLDNEESRDLLRSIIEEFFPGE
jgi:hypothetical protein